MPRSHCSGPNAERGQVQGGGSARVRTTRPSMPLAALQHRGVAVVHEPGCRIDKRLPPMRGEFRVRYTGTDGATGDEITDRLSFIWMDDPAPGVSVAAFGVSVNGSFVPDVTGDWQVSLTVVGSAVLRIDGEVMVDLTVPQTGGAFFGLGNNEIRVPLAVRGGRAPRGERGDRGGGTVTAARADRRRRTACQRQRDGRAPSPLQPTRRWPSSSSAPTPTGKPRARTARTWTCPARRTSWFAGSPPPTRARSWSSTPARRCRCRGSTTWPR